MKLNDNVRTGLYAIDGHRVYVEVDLWRIAKGMGRRASRSKGKKAIACLGAVEVKIVTPLGGNGRHTP